MSNSIWKKPGFHEAIDDKLKVSKDGKWVYWTMYGWNIPGEDVHDIGVEWAYLEDVLAQADKAERLQKAVDLIANMEQRLCIDDPVDILDDVLKIAKDEIKQLTKEQK